MADPAEKFRFGVPVAGAPATSQEIRENFEALAQNCYTTNPDFPSSPREYQTRILNDIMDPVQAGNLRMQVYVGGAWRDVMQHLEGGVAAPAKLYAEFTTPAVVWTVDHNLGSKPVALVFDATWRQLQPVRTFPKDVLYFGRSDHALVVPGLVAQLPARFEGRLLEVYGISTNGLTPSGGDIYQWEIDATPSGGGIVPVVGGALAIPGPLLPGAILQGTSPTSANIFGQKGGGGSEDIIRVTATPSGPGVGAIDLYAVAERSLQPGQYTLQHITDDRFVVTLYAPTAGYVILVG